MACQCMLDASRRMNEYLTSLVLTNAARSNMFVLERTDFRSARRFNALTKQYGIHYAPALIVIGTNGKPAYTVSGHFDVSDIEHFNAAITMLAQKK
ncbi:MAG: hypothetical protein HZC28_13210 [Spirochaetes bacterium]|nr:hypothetical protein [Spirochaetota bacterium]